MESRGKILNYTEKDEHVLRRLGGAVVVQWDSLPDDVKQRLLRQALSIYDRDHKVQLEQEIKSFIVKYKDT